MSEMFLKKSARMKKLAGKQNTCSVRVDLF